MFYVYHAKLVIRFVGTDQAKQAISIDIDSIFWKENNWILPEIHAITFLSILIFHETLTDLYENNQ